MARYKESKKQMREYKRRYREKYKIRSIWHRLRSDAKRRNKTCGISFEAFEKWCIETSYHLLKGRFAADASIDRIKDEIGYEEGNLRVLCVGDNASKENMRRKGIDWDTEQWKPVDIENF